MHLDPRTDPLLTLKALREVEGVCTLFESQWRGGQRPVIEHALAANGDMARSAMLRELLALELEYRLIAGESPEVAEYVVRFPAEQNIVDLTFLEISEAADRDETEAVANMHAQLHSQQAAEPLPRLFGDYELIEEIARGGMGVIYKARQISLDRIVAVKMILAGQLASPVDVERFHLEARAVAQLDHPHIVPIMEVGAIDGQHFFSMGFIEGVSLAQRISQGPLPPKVAAELLLCVVEALQYAHEQGVIHRDLKPANILLDARSRPRLTDFGLATQISNQHLLTATGQPIGTPAFMPPEQAAGKTEEVGPASDGYSLGAVLYTALTGRPPFQAASAMDTLKMVLEQEPLAPRRLDSTLPRDLETIALKCLEKNPAKRYASAQSLAEELRRFLSGQPIHARPVRLLERTHRWCRRNPMVAALTAVVTLLLVAVTVTSTVAALRISLLRDQAVEQQNIANANFVRAESERSKAGQNLQYAHQMIRQLADSYNVLGDQQQRTDHRLEWYEKAHGLFASLVNESPASLDSQAQLAASFGRLGLTQARAGSNSNAMEAFDQALRILRHLCEQHPEQPQYQRDLARAYNLLGRQYRLNGQQDASMAMQLEACRVQEILVSSAPPSDLEAGRDLATYWSDLAALQYDLDRIADSHASFDRARRCLERLAAQYPQDLELQSVLALLYSNIGVRRALRDSAQLLDKGREIFESVVQARPAESRNRLELARHFTAMAVRESQPSQALVWQLKAHDLWDKLVHDFPADEQVRRSMVWSLRDDARFLELAGHRQKATDTLRRALDQMGAVFTDDSPEMYANFEVSVLAMLARRELQTQNLADYRRHCRAILDHCVQRNYYENDLLRVCLILPDAVDDHQQLLNLAKDAASQGSRTVRKKASIGGALYRAGEYDEAVRVLTSVDEMNRLALMGRLGTAQIVRADNARAALFLAMAHARLGRSSDAASWLLKGRRWLESEGKLFAAAPDSSAGPVDPSAEPLKPNQADTAAPSTPQPDLEDRMMLADMVFEVQVLLSEAEGLSVRTNE